MSQHADKTLVCRDCGTEFVFSAGEQEFFAMRGFSEPSRCPDCRAARKAQRERGRSDSYGGSRDSRFGDRRGGHRDGGYRAPRKMYRVICADCGIETEVPFEPRSGRPVYCRDCFEKRRR